ncbi:hypothetical protein ABH922_000038 [Rhodococcus sp. 27YEA15]
MTTVSLIFSGDRDGGGHHCLQGLGGTARAVFLPEPECDADGDHDAQRDDTGVVGAVDWVCPDDVGHHHDHGEEHQNQDERILECFRELHDRRGRAIVADVVGTELRTQVVDLIAAQSVGGCGEIRQNGPRVGSCVVDQFLSPLLRQDRGIRLLWSPFDVA